MTYKECLIESMDMLCKDNKTLFVGYNVKYGRANGTLVNVDEKKLIETPVAENLMMGMSIGLSINGYKPVVYFERFDFILNAMDAMVNHLDKLKDISNEEYDPKVIIRVVIGGSKKPLFTGITHTQDFTEAIIKMVKFPVIKLENKEKINQYYTFAYNCNTSVMLIEERDLYDT